MTLLPFPGQDAGTAPSEPAAVWTPIIAVHHDGERERRHLVGHARSRQGAQEAVDAIHSRLGVTAEIGPSAPPDGEDPVPWRLLLKRAANGIVVEPLLVLSGAEPDPQTPTEGVWPLIRTDPGDLVLDLWRFPESWGRWDAASAMPDVYRRGGSDRVETLAEIGAPEAGGLHALGRLTCPPLRSRVSVSDAPLLMLQVLPPSGRSPRGVIAVPEAETDVRRRLEEIRFTVLDQWTIRPGEPYRVYEPEGAAGTMPGVWFGEKIRLPG